MPNTPYQEVVFVHIFAGLFAGVPPGIVQTFGLKLQEVELKEQCEHMAIKNLHFNVYIDVHDLTESITSWNALLNRTAEHSSSTRGLGKSVMV